jgi:hypothetical protein
MPAAGCYLQTQNAEPIAPAAAFAAALVAVRLALNHPTKVALSCSITTTSKQWPRLLLHATGTANTNGKRQQPGPAPAAASCLDQLPGRGWW